jgi:predicted alpha-1,2-mannosidase
VRPRLAEYLDRGYLALGGSEWGPPSITLEYAAADAAIARFAEALGDRGTAARFAKQAGSWRTLFDRSTGYVRPRAADGAWLTPFKPEDSWAFVEGNAAQYTFFVPHDLPALFEAMGGRSRAIERLDHLFSRLNAGVGQPYFYIGNEPQFGTPWAYSFAGAPVRTQEVVRRIVNRTFADGPGGLPGNDDLGATSSWYVFAALGLYPAVPGAGDLVLASPLFPAVTIVRPSRNRRRAAGGRPDAPVEPNRARRDHPLRARGRGARQRTIAAVASSSWASSRNAAAVQLKPVSLRACPVRASKFSGMDDPWSDVV